MIKCRFARVVEKHLLCSKIQATRTNYTDFRMNKFFNIIPGNGGCCLLLYGEIGGEVRSGDVMRELLEAERTYGRIDVRINSVGGEVYTSEF